MRQHPIRILELTTKNFWLLAIPLVRGLIALQFDVYNWLRGAWLDIVVILFIGGTAFFRWYSVNYQINDNSIKYTKGIFYRAEMAISYSCITAVMAEKRFFFRPIHAVNVHFDTNTGSSQRADFQITIREKEYDELFKKLAVINKSISMKVIYRPSKLNLLVFSLIFSSTLSGVIFLSTLLIQSSKIVGESLEEKLFTVVTDVSEQLALGLPPLAVAISIVFFAGWLFSFISNSLRYMAFRIQRSGHIIDIKTGFFTKRRYHINAKKINYVDLRQNLITKIFSISSVHVNCAGYGKGKNEIPVFIPITTKSQVYSSLQLLLPDISITKKGIKPKKMFFFRFIWLPFCALLALPVVNYFAAEFLPKWEDIINFLTIMTAIPMAWLLIVKITALLTTNIQADKFNFCLRYCTKFAFHTVIIPKEKIAKIVIRQHIFQITTNGCDVRIYTNSEFTRAHRIIALPLDQVSRLLEASGVTDCNLKLFPKKTKRHR